MRAVASSNTSTSGSRIHTRASDSSCASPADRPVPAAAEFAIESHRRRARRARPRRSASTTRVVGRRCRSNSATLSRIVPANSSTSWDTSATRRRSSLDRDVGDRHATEQDGAAWSARPAAARGGRRSSCRSRCARRCRPSAPRRVRSVHVAEHRLVVAVVELDTARTDGQRPGRRRRWSPRRGPSARSPAGRARAPSRRSPSAPSRVRGRGPRAADRSTGRTGRGGRSCRSRRCRSRSSRRPSTSTTTHPAASASCTNHHIVRKRALAPHRARQGDRAVLDEPPGDVRRRRRSSGGPRRRRGAPRCRRTADRARPSRRTIHAPPGADRARRSPASHRGRARVRWPAASRAPRARRPCRRSSAPLRAPWAPRARGTPTPT